MENNISAYLWGYKNYQAGQKSVETFRKFYPESDVFIRIDTDGDFENYKESTNEFNVDIDFQKSKLGYPGKFAPSGHDAGRTHWPYENLHTFLTSIYDCCKQTDSKYMIILEEDVFLLKYISIIKKHTFGIAIVPNNNTFPDRLTQFVMSVGGNIQSNGYGACGGAIINTHDFIKGYDIVMEPLKVEFDSISKYTHLVGWSDMMIQVIIMCSGGKVVVNNQLVEPWMQQKGWIDYSWKEYEIVNYLKEISLL
tara:strand:+ start:1464 stop:2219 length:756 start_codon:yes stop_codon:yes gene_type:complete